MKDYLRRSFQELENAFCDTLREAVHRGDLRRDTPARALARTLVTTAQGLALIECIADSSFIADVFTSMTHMIHQYVSSTHGGEHTAIDNGAR